MEFAIVIDEAACLGGLDPDDVAQALELLLGSGLALQDGFHIDADAIEVKIYENEAESMTASVAHDRADLAVKAASLGMPAPSTALERILVRNGGAIRSRPPRKGGKLKPHDLVLGRAKVMRCTAYVEAVSAGDQAKVDELQRTMKAEFRWHQGGPEVFTAGWRFAQLIDLVLDDVDEQRRATRAHQAMVIVFDWDRTYDPEFGPGDVFEGLNLQRLACHPRGEELLGGGRWWLGETAPSGVETGQ